ncbi:DUF1366 domain-containing protein [Aerococcaceae bacterium NML190073]|nr:DUF1366 domain-containing protein [Aerococcaceae bacterium NML190073]
MTWQVTKYPQIDGMGSVTATIVIIDSNMNRIGAEFVGNLLDKPDVELIDMVLEDFYQKHYFNRAESEAITQLNKDKEALEKKLAEATKIIDNHKQGMYELLAMIGAIAEHVGYDFEEENGDEDSQEDVSDGGDEMEGGE